MHFLMKGSARDISAAQGGGKEINIKTQRGSLRERGEGGGGGTLNWISTVFFY